MRYMEGYQPRGDGQRIWDTQVPVTDRIAAPDAANAIRILTSRLAANGFTTDVGSAEPTPQGGLEYYDVEVQQTVTTTVKVRAKNPESAARQVDHVNFKLPEPDDWDGIEGYTYIVRGPSDSRNGEILYEGDCQEFT